MLWEWGAYFTKEAIEEGLDVKISTWARNAPNTTPAMAKSVANYANAQLIKMEAIAEGYAEGIALDTQGNLSEGSGQNMFVVREGIIYTPPIGNSVLWGITRDSVMTIARELGFEVSGNHASARNALHRRRSVFCRHGRRGHADPVGRPREGGPGPARPDHRGDPAAILPDREWRGAGYPRLAAADQRARGRYIGSRQEPITYGSRSERAGALPHRPLRPTRSMHVNDLLKIAVDSGASDLHLKVGSYPMMRVRGTLIPATEERRLEHEDMVAMAAAVLPTGHRDKFKDNHEVDLAYSVAGLGRFRCNAFQQRGTIGMIFRVIPMRVATIEELRCRRC